MDFTPEESIRYSRHFVLPGFGTAGQERLKAGRVLVVGAGGPRRTGIVLPGCRRRGQDRHRRCRYHQPVEPAAANTL